MSPRRPNPRRPPPPGAAAVALSCPASGIIIRRRARQVVYRECNTLDLCSTTLSLIRVCSPSKPAGPIGVAGELKVATILGDMASSWTSSGYPRRSLKGSKCPTRIPPLGSGEPRNLCLHAINFALTVLRYARECNCWIAVVLAFTRGYERTLLMRDNCLIFGVSGTSQPKHWGSSFARGPSGTF